MGLQKIAAMRAEYDKHVSALDRFTDAAKQFSDAHAKITQAHEQVETLRKTQLAKVPTLDTMGIKEFEEYKKDLVDVYCGWSDRPGPIAPLQAVIAQKRKGIDDAVAARVAKLAASFPSEVKPGMVFRFEPGKALWEVVSGPTESTNKSHQGDAKKLYQYKAEGRSTLGTASLEVLKKNCKYIKS